jgi:hypothetical protein
MKVKFYQSKRLGFTKISSLVTLEFDLIFYIFFADFYLFSKFFKTMNNKFEGFKIRTDPILLVFTKFRKIQPVFVTLLPARQFKPEHPSER